MLLRQHPLIRGPLLQDLQSSLSPGQYAFLLAGPRRGANGRKFPQRTEEA